MKFNYATNFGRDRYEQPFTKLTAKQPGRHDKLPREEFSPVRQVHQPADSPKTEKRAPYKRKKELSMLFAFSSFSSAACFGSVSCLRSVTLQLVDSLFYSQLNSRQPRQATQTGEHTPGHPANNSRNECNIQIKNELSRLVSWLAGRMVCMEIKFRQKFQHSCWHPQNFCSTFFVFRSLLLLLFWLPMDATNTDEAHPGQSTSISAICEMN